MFNTLYLLNYNNYYNRLVKQENSLDGYLPYVVAQQNATNFNPNDHINTEHIVNMDDNITPDYAVLIDDAYNIVSRWFIMDSIRVRGNQYKLQLYRDTVADYYNIILSAPCLVERGYVNNNNPLVYNSENSSFNQIKKAEYLLKNNLETPWLVAYLSRYHNDEKGNKIYNTFTGSFKEDRSDLEPDYILNSLEDYEYYKFSYGNAAAYAYDENMSFVIKYSKPEIDSDSIDQRWAAGCYPYYGFFGVNKNGYRMERIAGLDANNKYPIYTPKNELYPSFRNIIAGGRTPQQAFEEFNEIYKTYDEIDAETGFPINSLTGLGTFEGYLRLRQESNKIIQVGDKKYRIVMNLTTRTNDRYRLEIPNTPGTLGRRIFDTILQESAIDAATWDVSHMYLNQDTMNRTVMIVSNENVPCIYFTYQDLSKPEPISYNFTYTANVTTQVPYEIIAAPLYNVTFQKGEEQIIHNGYIALSWFTELAQTQNLVYDVQIVPYIGLLSNDISNYQTINCYYTDAPSTPLATALKIPNASFTESHALDIPIEEDFKVAVNCDLYRFCSPNGIGDFDFNPAKNGGLIGYEVDCTLIPMNPYIKINPIFQEGYLYGGDYNDYRGLICKGDFSIPIVTNEWKNYQLNNKYYQDIFNRETESLELQNKWAMRETSLQAITGTLTGGVAGATAGGLIGGPWGAAAGAVVGTAASAAGGIQDIVKTKQLQADQMDLRQDLFDYNLKTIQARPNTLTRTSTYNINNKYFPYIEYYTCTDQEKEIFRNTIKYSGMTINAVGTIQEYINPNEETFVCGKILRLPQINEDHHVAKTLVDEIRTGIYIGGQ